MPNISEWKAQLVAEGQAANWNDQCPYDERSLAGLFWMTGKLKAYPTCQAPREEVANAVYIQ